MLVEAAIFKLLKTNVAVVAIASTRVYGGIMPDTAVYPAIVYRVVSRERGEALGQRGIGIAMTRFRIFSTMRGKDANAYRVTKNLDEAVRLCLQGYAGTVTDLTTSPMESIVIQYIRPDRTLDFYDDETQTFQVETDYQVWSEESIPS